MVRDHRKELRATPGPREDRRSKVAPGFDFSWVVPVNRRFGFTLSGNHVDQYSYENVATSTWRGNGFATNVAATATTGLPDTTPDKPYLTDFALRDSTRGNRADSIGTTASAPQSRWSLQRCNRTWWSILLRSRMWIVPSSRQNR